MKPDGRIDTPGESPVHAVGFTEALRVWARIGWLGFGGPAGQIALMHRELVERRRWISESRFLHALNYCMLLPGPEAQQLAIYIGWLLHRTWGGIVAGLLFVLPGALVLGVLSWMYMVHGTAPLVVSLFLGVKAAVLAIVVEAVLRIGRRALQGRLLVGVAFASFVSVWALRLPFPWIVVGAGALGWAVARWKPAWLPLPGETAHATEAAGVLDRTLAAGGAAHLRRSPMRSLRITAIGLLVWLAPIALAAGWLGSEHAIVRAGVFFSQAAVVTFGGAYAVLAYVAQQAVETLGWLQPGEMVDGLALAETTPGPLVLVLQFVGFVAAWRHPGTLDPAVAALLGAGLTTWVTCVPSFLFIFVGAPYVEALRRHVALRSALSAITAAVVGVILNLAIWFALHTLFREVKSASLGPLAIDVPVLAAIRPEAAWLSAAAMLAMLRFRLGLAWTLCGCALAGMAMGLRT